LKIKSLCCALVAVLAIVALSFVAESQTRRGKKPQRGTICFDPTQACKTTVTFEAYDLPFRIPANAVIYESEPFYAVILASARYKDEQDCEQHVIPETQRLEAQALFPNRKVFASRCYEAGNLFYTNVGTNTNFMAVYGGRNQAEAAQMLATVKATGKFPGANIRRMYTGFNGT
jgi:hypothetical protein